MALKVKFFALSALAAITLCCVRANAIAQVMPYRAAPVCKGQCGSPLCGPCIADSPYAYVPTRWRRWPVTQASATMAPEELPSPTPAKTPPSEEPAEGDTVPQLPMTPELPEPSTGPTTEPPTALTPPFGDAPTAPPFGDKPQVPVFGDEPQAPPSAADPLAAPFSDEPPQPPADTEQPVQGAEPTPSETTPSARGETPPGTAPVEPPASNTPNSGMPFDVGPPQMPSDDPFKDDPNQEPASRPQSGARLEQAYRETFGVARIDGSMGPGSPSKDAPHPDEPRLLHADGGSLEATRLPEEQAEPNPLRQVSHPVQRTVATQVISPQVKPAGGWRRNPLRER